MKNSASASLQEEAARLEKKPPAALLALFCPESHQFRNSTQHLKSYEEPVQQP
jgi:hypothetical protein